MGKGRLISLSSQDKAKATNTANFKEEMEIKELNGTMGKGRVIFSAWPNVTDFRKIVLLRRKCKKKTF